MSSKTAVVVAVLVALVLGGAAGYLIWGDSSSDSDTQGWNNSRQMGGRGPHMGGGGPMGGYCPMCGRPWDDDQTTVEQIPDQLPTPKNKEWVSRLKNILSREKLSYDQYRADSEKYDVWMPYNRVIPQENDHIEWIEQLFAAYGIDADVPTPAIQQTDSISEAFNVAQDLEQDLITRYQWLIANAEDDTTQEVLDNILFQTRMHYMMFAHASGRGRMGMHR